MSTPWRRVGEWLGEPAPAERVAVLRILTGLFATVYLAVRLPVFTGLADRSRATFEPVGVLWWVDAPLPDAVVVALVVAALVLGAAFTAGALFRATGPAFALVLLVLTTYRSSWGQLLWFENLLVLHVMLVGFSRSADTLSVDQRRRPGEAAPSATAYAWPVRIAAIVTVITYLLAGIAKLRIGGLDWMSGDTLRNHVAYSATRLEVLGGTPSPFARAFLGQRSLSTPVAVATIVMEIGAPIALLGGRWRTGWVVSAWLFHVGIATLMLVVFPYPLLLVAFAPLFPLERLVHSVTARRKSASSAA